MTNEKKLFYKKLRAMLGRFVPILIVCAILCLISIKTIEDVVYDNGSQTVSVIKNNIDERLMELVRFSKAIELSKENYVLKNQNDKNENVEYMYKLSNSLREYLSTNDMSDSMYIYYPGIDTVISDKGCFTTNAFYLLREMPSIDRYEEWMSVLMSNEKSGIRQIPYHDGFRLAYIDKLHNSNGICMVLVVEISEKTLQNILYSYSQGKNTVSCIFMNEQAVVTAGETEIMEKLDEIVSKYGNTVSTRNLIRNNYYVFRCPSAFTGLDYVQIGTTKDLFQAMDVVLWGCIIGIGLMVLIIFIISVRISKKDSRSMQELLDKIGKNGIEKTEKDEMSYIGQCVDQLILERFRSEKQMIEYQARLSGLFVANVISNSFSNEAEVFQVASQYGVSFDGLIYRIIILSGEMEPINANEISIELSELSYGCISGCLVTYNNRYYTVLVNSDYADNNESIIVYTEKLLGIAFKNKPSFGAIGGCCDTMVKINESYKQALTVLDRAEALEGSRHTIRLYDYSEYDDRAEDPEIKDKTTISKRETKIAETIKARIDYDYKNPDLGLYLLADELHLSNSYLSMAFKKTYGVGVAQYINGKRIEKAKQLLLETDKSVKEIATEVGFSSDLSFIRVFKRYENKTPSSIRN